MHKDELERLMEEYAPVVFRNALAMCCNVDTAQDITQQTFLLLLEKRPRFSYREQLLTWLLRTARKVASYEHRKNNSTTLNDISLPPVTDKTAFELLDLLEGLSEALREVTVLFYVEDMSVDDIACVLGISRSAVKTRLFRAREALEKMYKEELL